MVVPAEAPGSEQSDDFYDLAEAAQVASAAPTRVQTVQPPAAVKPQQASPSPLSMFPTRTRRQEVDEGGGKAKKLVVGSIALVLVLGSATVLVKLGQKAHKTAGPALGDDAYVEAHLDDGATADVEEWLDKSNRRMVMGMSNSQAKALAANLKQLGAKRVVAFGASMTMSLGVELPSSAPQRKALFDWERDHHFDFTKPLPKDVGQRWLLVMLKP
jgi:hypothetical protein